MYAPVTERDIPAVVRLLNRAYRGSGATASWCNEDAYLAGDRTTDDLLRTDMAGCPAAAVLKWEDGPARDLIGCVWLEPTDANTWYLGSFAVDPRRQNGGLGRVMLEAAETWVRQRGGVRVRMTVINVRDTLIAWYLRRGYVRTGATEPFPYGDDRFGRPLRDDLCFVVLEKSL